MAELIRSTWKNRDGDELDIYFDADSIRTIMGLKEDLTVVFVRDVLTDNGKSASFQVSESAESFAKKTGLTIVG